MLVQFLYPSLSMNKINALGIVVILALASCNNNSNTIQKSEKAVMPVVKVKDVTITETNSYSDLFLDTAAVTNFISRENAAANVADDIRSFYNLRNFQFAWFASDGLTEQAKSFWNLASFKKDTSLANKTLSKKLKVLLEEDSLKVKSSDTSIVNTELMLTEYFVRFMTKDYEEDDSKHTGDLANIIPRKKNDIMLLADSFANAKDGAYDDANQSYQTLKLQLAKYVGIAKKGGWPLVAADKKSFVPKAANPAIAAVKKRLMITGELDASDTSAVYDSVLLIAVKNYQSSVGIKADGKYSDRLIKQLNISVQKRIETILINLDRMRWLPDNKTGQLIVANIPEFKVYVYDSSKEQFNMNTVVGKEGHSTVIFTGNLNQVVFAPYWNIPASIVKKEILPGIKRNGSYLAKHNMEKVNGNYRQKPGGQNSLGKVKFLFPNDFDIYFHDTPSKWLFNKDQRAYSHGCIRLAEPEKMANYLLRNDTTWNKQRIDSAMNAAIEKTVYLKKSVPVLITYYTAWVSNNVLNFRDDIYGNDSAVARKLFTNPL